MEQDVKLTKLTKCGGCGAKVGAGVLAKILGDIPVIQDENLIVGFDKSDDACVYRVNDEIAMVQTLDFFPPMVDDPYEFGQVAAANALSDIYAMGGQPRTALNILMVPEAMDKDTIHKILAGGYAKAAEAGAVIAGGHSIFDETPKYGLSVTGFVHPDRIWKNFGAKPGDVLILTKALGVGIVMTGARAQMADPDSVRQATEQMMTLNKNARDGALPFRIHACTDVTGFSLMGHLLEMMQGSDTSAELSFGQISLLPGVVEFAEIGVLPEGLYRNRQFAEEFVDASELNLAEADVLFGPETSGGLLLAVDPEDADALFEAIKNTVPCAQRIGTVVEKREKRIILHK
ncbi:MAG: selenide, water dikinase SelD [Clostridia bacterium]|nr:selenide, water dikinase SelD [Clostridia bacterium]